MFKEKGSAAVHGKALSNRLSACVAFLPCSFLIFQGLKHRLRGLGISKLEQSPDALIFSFSKETRVAPQAILNLIRQPQRKNAPPIRLTPDSRLLVSMAAGSDLFETVRMILTVLEGDERK